MAYIEFHQSLSRHKKTLRAAAALRIDRHKLIGHLAEMWWWALDNLGPTGFLGDLTDQEIADAAEWPKDAEAFVKALAQDGNGFIDLVNDAYRERWPHKVSDREDGRYLHDWWHYAGKLLDRRRMDAERKRQQRGASPVGTSDAAFTIPPTDGDEKSNGRPPDIQGMSARTVPYRTVAKRSDSTVTTIRGGSPAHIGAVLPTPAVLTGTGNGAHALSGNGAPPTAENDRALLERQPEIAHHIFEAEELLGDRRSRPFFIRLASDLHRQNALGIWTRALGQAREEPTPRNRGALFVSIVRRLASEESVELSDAKKPGAS